VTNIADVSSGEKLADIGKYTATVLTVMQMI
jgi:hypothetical protein